MGRWVIPTPALILRESPPTAARSWTTSFIHRHHLRTARFLHSAPFAPKPHQRLTLWRRPLGLRGKAKATGLPGDTYYSSNLTRSISWGMASSLAERASAPQFHSAMAPAPNTSMSSTAGTACRRHPAFPRPSSENGLAFHRTPSFCAPRAARLLRLNYRALCCPTPPSPGRTL